MNKQIIFTGKTHRAVFLILTDEELCAQKHFEFETSFIIVYNPMSVTKDREIAVE